MIKAWSDLAWEEYEYWQTQDKKTIKRICKLLKDIDRNGYDGIGKPEMLSGDLAGYYSRRIVIPLSIIHAKINSQTNDSLPSPLKPET